MAKPSPLVCPDGVDCPHSAAVIGNIASAATPCARTANFNRISPCYRIPPPRTSFRSASASSSNNSHFKRPGQGTCVKNRHRKTLFRGFGATYPSGSGLMQSNSPVLTSKIIGDSLHDPSVLGGNMSLVRKGIFLFLAFSMLALLVGCGSSNSNSGHANSVGFSNSSLSGTYVFSTQGSDANTGGLLTLAGILSASNGNLSGAVDVIAPDGNFGITRNAAISSGSYSVGSDGRGQATFNVAVPAGTATFVLDFVLTSNTHGLVTEF